MQSLNVAVCCATGYDFINSAEATAAEVMSAAGYNSIHYGKW
jgi:arylsulfatase A-like enzyme